MNWASSARGRGHSPPRARVPARATVRHMEICPGWTNPAHQERSLQSMPNHVRRPCRPWGVSVSLRSSATRRTQWRSRQRRAIAAPRAPARCARRSLQSRHSLANARRSRRVLPTSTPSRPRPRSRRPRPGARCAFGLGVFALSSLGRRQSLSDWITGRLAENVCSWESMSSTRVKLISASSSTKSL